MKFNNLTNTFTAGEWSPKMRARTDAKEYGNACETMKNFLPKVQGGAYRRPGTLRYTLDASADADLQNAHSLTAVKSKMFPKVLSNGYKAILFAFDTQPSTTWFALDAGNIDSLSNPLTVSSGANYTCSAKDLRYVQVGDIGVLALSSTGVGKAPRIWDATLTFGNLNLMDEMVTTAESYKTVPYRDIQALGSSVNITPSGTTGAITLTASSAFFNAGHVGTYFKLSAAGSTGAVKVTGFTSSTVVSATVVFGAVAASAHGTAAGTSWQEGAWSDYRGWPRTVTSYQGRLIFGGNSSQPDTLWGSRIGNIYDFSERIPEQDPSFDGYPNDNSRPFTLTPNTGSSGNIRALSAGKTLVILTDRAEIVGYGTQNALGPNDVTFESSTSFGAADAMAARTNNFLTFIQKGGRRIRDISFNFDQDQYKSSDLSFVSDHLTLDLEDNSLDPVVEIVGAEIDSSYLWAKTQNGRLLCLTVDRDYQINAWSQIVLGGTSSVKTHPLIKSVCAIDSGTTAGDRVFMITSRYINGAHKVFVEYFDTNYEFSSFNERTGFPTPQLCMDLKDFWFDAGGVALIPAGTDRIGETLQVVADGNYIGEFLVDSLGNMTLPAPYINVVFGYKVPAVLKPMPMEIGAQVPGTPQAFMKKVDEISIKFYQSRGCKYGYKESDMYDIDFKDPLANMNAIPEFFTGLKTLKMPSNYDREAQVILKTDSPWPCNVLAIIAKGVLYD
jgi:hypothetical protein